MPNTLRPFLGLLLVTLLAGACASAGEPGATTAADATPTEGTFLRVHNTDSSLERLTIFLVPASGEMRRLGVVEPNEYLTVPHTAGRGRFTLQGERPTGTRVTSPAIDIQQDGTYTWDIALRRITRSR
jgi:hypothetical protein